MSRNASEELRLSAIVKPVETSHGRMNLAVPAAIVRELGIIAEWIEYTLEVHEGGVLVYTPRARILPWTIGSQT